MRYYTCFDDVVDDGVPRGWDAKWAVADGRGPTNVYIGSGASSFVPVKRRALRHWVKGGIPSGLHSAAPGAIAWAVPGSLSDFQLLSAVSLYGDSSSFSVGFALRFRAFGLHALERSGYYFRVMSDHAVATGDRQKTIFGKTVAGVDYDLTSVANAVSPSSVLWLRLIVSGTHIQFRAWADGSAEPSTWDIDINDSTFAGAGWIGYENYWDQGGGAGMFDVNFVSLATGTDTPVVPLTNKQFTAWLGDQTATRRYLAELSAIGYAANGGQYVTNTASNGIQFTGPLYTKEVKVYLSDGGFTSQYWDSPSTQLYNAWITKIPTFKRDMGQALSGKASVGIGTLSVSNPADSTGVGVRDRWLRMKWKRNYVKVFMGDPSWPKHDFRCIVLGRLQCPVVGADISQIDFTINDLSDVLNNDINQAVITFGDYAGQRQPITYGGDAMDSGVLQVEPPLIDSANLIYQLSRRTVAAWASNLSLLKFVRVYDNQVPLWKQQQNVGGVTVTATDTLTWNGHGMVDGWLFVAYQDASSGLSMNFAYYVRNSTANTFQLSTTPSGPIVTGLNTLLPGSCAAFGFGYRIDANGDGLVDQSVAVTVGSAEKPALMQLVSKPVGRVTVSGLQDAGGADQISVLKRMALDAGISQGSINPPISVYDSRSCMYYVGASKTKAGDVISKFAQGIFGFYGFSPEGFFEYGLISLTSGTTVLGLQASDIKDGTMKLLAVKPPVDFSKAQISLPWFLTGGAFQTGSQAALQGKAALKLAIDGTWGWPDGTQPLDTYPQIADMDQTYSQEVYYTDLQFLTNILYPFYQKSVGVFQFDTRLTAMQLRPGQRITVTLPRQEWRSWFGPLDSASPDNTGTVFSFACTVLGIEFNPAATDPFGVRLTVAKQLVGYYPTVDVLDGDVAQNSLLEEDGVSTLLEESVGGGNLLEENGIV